MALCLHLRGAAALAARRARTRAQHRAWTARRAILDQYLHNVIATTPHSAARVFGWSLADTRQAAEALAEEGRLSLDVKVSGIGELQMVTRLM